MVIAKSPPVTICVTRLPEGVWLAVSDDIPGLVVETDTRDEAIDLARELALELLREEGRGAEADEREIVFLFR
jgi:predicted RNase H-like HicB family nuclease